MTKKIQCKNPVLDRKFSFFETSYEKFVCRRVLDKKQNDLIQIAVFLLQFEQLYFYVLAVRIIGGGMVHVYISFWRSRFC